MVVLDINRLTVRHADTPVLSDVTMAVERSEIIGVLGAAGSGKSALIQAVTGVRPPDRGTITLLGSDITNGTEDKRGEARLARTVDSGGLLSMATIREHLIEEFERGGWASKRHRLIHWGRSPVDEVIEALELAADADRQLCTLPLGLRRRFELARSLMARDPAIVVADGLTLGLNGSEAVEFVRLCRRVRDRRGVSMLITDRNPDFIYGASDYVYVLDAGRVIARGDPESIRGRREVAAALEPRGVTPEDERVPEMDVTGYRAAPPLPMATQRTHTERLESALQHFRLRRTRPQQPDSRASTEGGE